MSIVALLRKNPHPTNEEIRIGLQGNLCRCSGYVKLLDSISQIAREGLDDL